MSNHDLFDWNWCPIPDDQHGMGKLLVEPTRIAKPNRIRVGVNYALDLSSPKYDDEDVGALFGIMAACPQHTFVLTIRDPARLRAWFEWFQHELADPDNNSIAEALAGYVAMQTDDGTNDGNLEEYDKYREMIADARHIEPGTRGPWPLPNVWILVTADAGWTSWGIPKIDEQAIRDLLHIPAVVRGLHLCPRDVKVDEGPVDQRIEEVLRTPHLAQIDWILVDLSEDDPLEISSFSISALRALRDRCADLNVPFRIQTACVVDPIGISPLLALPRRASLPQDPVPMPDKKPPRITPARRAAIRAAALRYMADHMRAVLDIDPGPHEIAETDEEERILVAMFEREADKIEDRADKMKAHARELASGAASQGSATTK